VPTGGEVLQNILICVGLFLYLVYSTTMMQALQMQDCQEYDYGAVPAGMEWRAQDYGKHSFLAQDHSVDCSSPLYGQAKATSAVLLFVYGFGIPLSVVGLLLRRAHALHAVNEINVFGFLMSVFKRASPLPPYPWV
jgi:hypothetical protein